MASVLLEHLPQCPPPEVDVEVVDVLQVSTMPSIPGRAKEVFKDRMSVLRRPALVAPSNPSSSVSVVVISSGLMPVIRRVPQADHHWGVALDLECPRVLLREGLEEEPQIR